MTSSPKIIKKLEKRLNSETEVVSWVSEYRVYVVHSQIRSIDHYDGNPNVLLDIDKVICTIQALENAKESYAGYAIDFGVLDSGQTTLVEMNDGFAIGAYKIDKKNYTDIFWQDGRSF
ncbi:ATP-grasp domain-containing protein [Nostoc sp. LPT]|uniref:ATP-grasp domain-containing protein n=1 Tax=Nostoc sp. LPT TaxID=2815387 RepID=UPI0034527827